jgi:hypothetical protein
MARDGAFSDQLREHSAQSMTGHGEALGELALCRQTRARGQHAARRSFDDELPRMPYSRARCDSVVVHGDAIVER